MIREATKDDLDMLVPFAARYAAKANHPSVFNDETTRSAFANIIDNENAIFLVNDDVSAAMATWVYPLFFNPDDIIAECAFIWSDTPGDGKKMLRQSEKWAEKHGARYFHLMALKTRERVASLYRREGYQPLETTFMKEL